MSDTVKSTRIEDRTAQRTRILRALIAAFVFVGLVAIFAVTWPALNQHRILNELEDAGCSFETRSVKPKWLTRWLDDDDALWQSIAVIEDIEIDSVSVQHILDNPKLFQECRWVESSARDISVESYRSMFGASSDGLAPGPIFGKVRQLHLNSANIGDEHLSTLTGLRNLYYLSLDFTHVTDAGLAELARHTTLQSLTLQSTGVTGSGFAHITGLKDLTFLDLSSNAVDDEGLAIIAKISSLQSLYLEDTFVTDAGLVHLASLPLLRSISLTKTGVTDVGMDSLAKCRTATMIDLSNTSITDAGLLKLAALPVIGDLDVGNTQVTEAGVSAFHEARRLFRRSECGVVWSRTSINPGNN